MRILFLMGALGIAGWLIRERWQSWRRRQRGEPEPVQHGPRTITLVLIAMLIVYSLLIGYRLIAGH